MKPMRYTCLRNLDNVHSFLPLPNSLQMMRGLWICAAGSWQWPYYLPCAPLNGGTNLRYSYVGGLAVYQGADGAVLFSSQEDDYKKGNRPWFLLHLELNVVELIPSDSTCSFSKTQLYGASVYMACCLFSWTSGFPNSAPHAKQSINSVMQLNNQ